MENKEIKESYINEKTGIEYKKVGDYFVPNIILEQEQKVILNKYGRARLKFLKENKRTEYSVMFMDGTLNNHIKEIQKIVEERLNFIINQMTKQENTTEELKENNQMEWVKSMNNIQNRAEEIIYNENNSHYLVNYFKYINFKNLDSFINSLIEICKTITNTNFIPIGDIKAFGINDNNIYKSLTTNPLYNKKDVHLITITPINKIIFVPEKIELNEDTKELNKTETNNIYVKCNIVDTNNTITINKYNKVESKYNNSDIIITTDLILNSETTFHIGRIEGE